MSNEADYSGPLKSLMASTALFWQEQVQSEIDCVAHYAGVLGSPIETVFLCAWNVASIERKLSGGATGCGYPVSLINSIGDMKTWLNGADASELTVLKPQQQLGAYRVDFLIERICKPCIKDQWLVAPKVIVECDGHEFHERTKEQAQRDKSRDRDLQAEGFYVLRFTGSEIWRDPMACVRQTNDLIDGHIRKTLGEQIKAAEIFKDDDIAEGGAN